MNRLRIFGPLVTVVIITLWAWASFVNNAYFSHHDSQHIARLYVFVTGISQGQWYPRWVDLFGFNFGYALFNFYPPLVYYAGALFHLFGASYVWSIKLVGITGFIIAAYGAYCYVRNTTDNKWAAYMAAILYTYAPYHGVNLYVRGALAEFVSMAVLPWVFVALEALRRGSKWGGVGFAAALGLLMLAHPLIAFPSTFFIAAYIGASFFATKRRREYFVHTLVAGVMGLAVSAYFWVPSMVERSYTLVDTMLTRELASYQIHFIEPWQLWSSAWGYGGSGAGLADNLSFQLGKLHILFAATSLMLLPTYLLLKKQKTIHAPMLFPFAIMSFFLIFAIAMTLSVSRPLWDAVSFLWYLQFPWRFLTFVALFISIVAAYSLVFIMRLVPERLNGRFIHRAMTFAVVAVLIILGVYSQSRFRPEAYWSGDDRQWTRFEEIAWRVSRTSHEFAPYGVALKTSEYGTTIIDISKDEINKTLYETQGAAQVDVKNTNDDYAQKTFTVRSPVSFQFVLRRFSFPGWTAYIDGEASEISSFGRYKLMQISVPPGEHEVRFAFENTPIRTISSVVSMVAIFTLLGWIAYQVPRIKA